MRAIQRCAAVVFDAYGTLLDIGAPTQALLNERADALACTVKIDSAAVNCQRAAR